MSDDCGLGEGTHWICECQQERIAALDAATVKETLTVEEVPDAD